MGGAFQNQEESSGKKLSKEEIEILLKKGILGFIDQDQSREQQFQEDDIEQILQKNSRIAKYSLVGGNYSISKVPRVCRAPSSRRTRTPPSTSTTPTSGRTS